jgi:glycosyltransferase involved in cell wall biosynthesis
MVKNEERILLRCLQSVENLVDHFCICDTGSTDNTVAIAEEFLKSHSGCITHEPWKNFGHNRTKSFQHAKRFITDNLQVELKDVYGLLLDADMKFVGNLKSLPLHHEAYSILQINGRLEYYNTRIIRMDINAESKGPTHEYWDVKSVYIPRIICHIDDVSDGGCKSDKFDRDIKLLTEALLEEPNNVRYMFYLAQSYKDCGNIAEAIKWYKKRYDAGGWFGEVYISAYQISRLTNDKEWVWKAYEADNRRVEAFYSYIHYHRLIGKFTQELYAMALHASNIKLPDNALFLEADVYNWKIHDELSIIAYYTGHKDVALMASTKLLSENKFPEDQRERIIKNKSFSI